MWDEITYPFLNFSGFMFVNQMTKTDWLKQLLEYSAIWLDACT